MPEPLWVASLNISQATRAKLSDKHSLDADEVRDAIVGARGYYRWDDDPDRGLRALVEVKVRNVTVVVVLYPTADPLGDVGHRPLSSDQMPSVGLSQCRDRWTMHC